LQPNIHFVVVVVSLFFFPSRFSRDSRASLGKVKSLSVQFGLYLATVGIEMDEFDLYFKLLEGM
jgi:hypothetical protein